MANPFSKQWIVCLPDMPHLTKNIVTSLDELSSSKNLKRNLMYGKVPLNMQMIEEVWLKCDRASGQFQSSKLTSRHFNKNAVDRGDDSLCNSSRQWNHAQPEQQKHV